MSDEGPEKPEQKPEPGEPKTRLSDGIVFELDDFDRHLVDELLPKSAEPGRWAAMNAVRHANRAWKIREVDPAMAAFRAITGEEEAASALFRAFRRVGYPNAEKLNPRSHVHKNAVTPFLDAVFSLLALPFNAVFPRGFALSVTAEGRIVIKLIVENGTYEPTPPLHMFLTEGKFLPDRTIDRETERPVDFGNKIAEQAATNGAVTVKAYLKERANLRNLILYAGENGHPEVRTPIDPFLRLACRNTFTILKVYLLIDQYEVQTFARQCLLAFLKTVADPTIEVVFE